MGLTEYPTAGIREALDRLTPTLTDWAEGAADSVDAAALLRLLEDWATIFDAAAALDEMVPVGWRLVEKGCETCGAIGETAWVPPDSHEPTVLCPDCFGAGGFPVLMRPCDGCNKNSHPSCGGDGWIEVGP